MKNTDNNSNNHSNNSNNYSNRDERSLQTLSNNEDRYRDTIKYRVEFIRELLRGKTLQPLVNFAHHDTEYFAVGSHDSDTEERSNDTRYDLNKRMHNFNKIITEIGGNLQYIKSGTGGHTFKGQIKIDDNDSFEYAVKVVAYTKKKKYGGIYDTRRHENAEIKMLRLLSYFIVNKKTPHIILPVATFNTKIDPFLNLLKDEVVDDSDEKYIEFINNYKKGYYHDEVSILISEWANRGDLLDYIRKNYAKMNLIHWKVFFFQIISTFAVIQSKFPSFRHNDAKANNFLIHKTKMNGEKPTRTYVIVGKTYRVIDVGYMIKLWDFDFACIPGIVDNMKTTLDWTKPINVTTKQHRYYDIHYFFNTLVFCGFFPNFMNTRNIPDEVKEFVKRIIPEKYRSIHCKHQRTVTIKKRGNEEIEVIDPCIHCHSLVHEKGRLLVDDEYITPDKILEDPFFDDFRFDETRISKIKQKDKQRKTKKTN